MKIEQCKNKAEIKEVIKSLLKKSFLMKAKDNNLEHYLIAQDNLDVINEFLEILDYEAKINREMEVISVSYIGNDGAVPPIYKLTMNEMKIFVCLLVIFTHKVQKDLISPDSVKASIKELITELSNRDLRLIPNSKITVFQNALAILSRYNLIEYIDREMQDEYSEFRILPSIVFAKDDYRIAQMLKSESDVEEKDNMLQVDKSEILKQQIQIEDLDHEDETEETAWEK